jgi:hypothetical protein
MPIIYYNLGMEDPQWVTAFQNLAALRVLGTHVSYRCDPEEFSTWAHNYLLVVDNKIYLSFWGPMLWVLYLKSFDIPRSVM